MKVKDILEVQIVSEGMEGEGVAKIDNYVVFVPLTLVGEIVKIEITEVKKKFARGKVIKLIKASEYRQQPKCPIFYKCGGCEMQHILYDKQLEIKRNTVKNCLDKACNMDIKVNDVVTAYKQFGYRNKVQVPLRNINGKTQAGLFKKGSHTFVPFKNIEEESLGNCVLHSRQIQNIIDTVCNFIDKTQLSTYDELKHVGLIRHLVIRRVTDKFSICIVINGNSLPKYMTLVEDLKRLNIEFSLYISVNTKRTNVILGDSVKVLYGESSISSQALGVKFFVNPMSFLQVNDDIRDLIYEKVTNEIIKEKDAIVIDAYSGIGITSNILAKNAKKVIGIEIVKEAVEDANRLAEINSNKNIENICGDAAVELPKVMSRFKNENVVMLLDPPRKGCDDNIIQSILESLPKKIVYISCNPATLARDVSKLVEEYEIKEVIPYDMFPQTGHVETVVLLSKGEVNLKKIRVEFSLEDMEMSEFQDGATYPQIKEYVWEHSGLKVSNLYISQIKRKCGLEVGKNYNLPKSEDSRQSQCPPEKEKAIREAFEYFGMI